eukprot:6261217-Prorocentrum_lima.AAC.1
MSWRSGKQCLTALSSCEAELVGMVAGVQNGIHLLLILGELSHSTPIARVMNDNSAALQMV